MATWRGGEGLRIGREEGLGGGERDWCLFVCLFVCKDLFVAFLSFPFPSFSQFLFFSHISTIVCVFFPSFLSHFSSFSSILYSFSFSFPFYLSFPFLFFLLLFVFFPSFLSVSFSIFLLFFSLFFSPFLYSFSFHSISIFFSLSFLYSLSFLPFFLSQFPPSLFSSIVFRALFFPFPFSLTFPFSSFSCFSLGFVCSFVFPSFLSYSFFLFFSLFSVFFSQFPLSFFP